MCSNIIRIAVINCDIPFKPILDVRGPFDRIFNDLLSPAAARISQKLKLPITIQTTGYNCVDGEYPLDLANIDVMLFTGSKASAYDELPWIAELTKYIRHIYLTQSSIKLVGSCFGHQIICQALLSFAGGRVEKSPSGWEIGVQTVYFTQEFAASFPSQIPPTLPTPKLDIQFVHADHVVVPASGLPAGWIAVGRSDLCALQGVYEPQRVLTLQGHAEFDRFISGECMKTIGENIWPEEEMVKALREVDWDDDSAVFADIIVEFCLQENAQ